PPLLERRASERGVQAFFQGHVPGMGPLRTGARISAKDRPPRQSTSDPPRRSVMSRPFMHHPTAIAFLVALCSSIAVSAQPSSDVTPPQFPGGPRAQPEHA